MPVTTISRQQFLEDRQGRTLRTCSMMRSNRSTGCSSSSTAPIASVGWRNRKCTTIGRRLLAWCANSNRFPRSIKFSPPCIPPHQASAASSRGGGANDHGAPRLETNRQEGVVGRSRVVALPIRPSRAYYHNTGGLAFWFLHKTLRAGRRNALSHGGGSRSKQYKVASPRASAKTPRRKKPRQA